KEVRTEHPDECQEEDPDCERRECEQDQRRCHECCPCEQWHTHVGHTRGTHVDDCDEEVDPRHERTRTCDLQADRIEVDPVTGRSDRQGCVGCPACVRCSVQEPAEVQEQPTEEEHPETKGVDEWKRYVTRPYL